MPLCLIVDDHSDTLEGYVEYLAASGFDAIGATDGAGLLSNLERRTPDAIVLDLQLPGRDGWELIRQLRADPRWHAIPIVVVSACVLPAERQLAEEAGCNAFLGKPVDPAAIVEAVHRLLSARQLPE